MRFHHRLFGLLLALLPVQLGYHFWPQWSYVLGLRIDYLSPTVFLTDILVVLILLLWLFDGFRVTPLRPEISRLRWGQASFWLKKHWWILAFFVFLLVNSLLAQNQEAALCKLLKLLEFVLLGLYVAKNSYVSRITYHVLPIAVLYSSLIAFVQFLKQSSLGGIFWYLGERTFNSGTPGIAKIDFDGRLLMRPYATFPHPNALAGFVLIGLILTFPYLFKKNKLFAVIYLLLATAGLIVSFSRSSWLVGLLVVSFWFFRKTRGRKAFIWVLSTFIVVIIAFFGKRMIGQESFLQRLDLARAAWSMVSQNPLIGVGLNNFIPAIPSFWQNIGQIYWLQPVHNIYLLAAAETGLIGLLIFLWFIYLTYRKLSPNPPAPSAAPYQTIQGEVEGQFATRNFLTALTVVLLLGLFDHYWLTLQQTQLLFCIVLGFAWGYTRPGRGSTSLKTRAQPSC